MTPTLTDISRKTGLSVATVSNTLNGRPGYSHATRQLVLRTAEELGYTANPLARGLLGKGTNTVGLLWSLAGPHLSQGMARDIALRMQKRGYLTHLADSLSDENVVRPQLADFRRRGVDAVIIQQAVPGLLTEGICRQLRDFKAAVAVGSSAPALEMDWIHPDMAAGWVQAAEHLSRIGRRRPAVLISARKSESKVEAFLKQCRQGGMDVSDSSVIDFDYGGNLRRLTVACRGVLEQKFPQDFPFDVLMCSADEVSASAMAWLRGRGLRVPEDVAVVGCNNALFAESMLPPLASIDRRDEDVADAIEAMVFSRLAQPDLPARRQKIAMQFVWRESAGSALPGSGDGL